MPSKLKGKKILLGVTISLIIIGAGITTTFLTINWPAVWNDQPPEIHFPLADSNVVEGIWGYGEQNGEFHNGIDFICNSSVDVIAGCQLRVKYITTFQNDVNSFWQTNIKLQYNRDIEFELLFEPMSANETHSTLQREAIPLSFGQIVAPGETIGTLLKFGNETLLHFGARFNGDYVCAYQFFTPTAKTTFLTLWNENGYGDGSWYV